VYGERRFIDNRFIKGGVLCQDPKDQLH
jgi:hypothetical protein